MKTLYNLFVLLFISGSMLAQTIDTSLVAYFPFNGNAIDVTGNGHNGTVNGGILTNDRFNQTDKAYTFPNLHNNIVLDNSTGMNLENGFTLNTWVKYKNINCGIVGKHNCWVVNGFYLGIDNGHFWLRLANSVWSDIVTSEVYVEDQWYMVTGVYDHATSTGKVYVNGVLKASGSVLYNNYSSAPITISEASNGCPDGNMPGAIDEVKIYNRPLSDAEILAEYNNASTDLVLFLPFNGNAKDESGSGNNGTVSGSSLTQDRFGVNSRAYNFNGTNNYISIADNPNLFSDELTISWWYKMSEMIGGRVVIGWVDGGHRYQQFFNNDQLNYFNGYNVNQGGTYFNPIYTLTDLNVWKNIVVTYKKLTESTSTTSIYVDGELKQTDNHTLAMDYASGPDFFIGKNHNGNFFKGALDDFRIFNRILNDTEILGLYQDSTTYSPQLISSVYPLQNSNNCLFDESIKIYFAEPMNEATFTYNSVSTFGSLTGSYELSFSYQSSNNSLEIMPTVPFKYGEQITVTLDTTIQSVSGYSLSPFTFQFNVKPEIGSVKFAVADSFQLNFPPSNILSGDFNNDGKMDVIVSNYDSLKLSVLLGNGLGGFTQGEISSGEYKPYSISTTDIDSDRDLDLIVSTNEENKIRILRGTGQGIFHWVLPTINANLPIATCPGDFDGDGDNDFVALCNNGFAIVYKNNGAGSFTVYDTISTSVASIRNIVGDIDNDGDLDIIGGTPDYWGVFKILENNMNADFTYNGGPYLGPYPDEIAGGDLDGDYDLDFVKYDWYQNGIGIGVNNGVGEFPVEDFINLGNVGGQTRNPVVNDFDGDGDQDFVGVFNSNNIGIVKNNTHPNYELALSYPIAGLNGIAPGDFDNNGSIDLVGITTTTNQVKFIKNCLDSLVAYYPFNGNANDESGNINNGTIFNASIDMDRYGNPNSSLFFAGDGYVEGINPGNNLPKGNSPRSFTAWINTGVSNPNGSNIFHYGTSEAAPTNFHFLATSTAGLGNGYGYGIVYGSTNVADGFWHFVAGVYEGGTERNTQIYVDGKLDGIGQITTEPNTVLNSKWSIGKFMSGFSSFSGYVDEIKVYNEVLSDEEIWNLYKVTTTSPNLILPVNNSTINTLTPLLQWDSLITAVDYRLELSSDSLFSNNIISEVVPQKTYQVQNGVLTSDTNYYWRVRTATEGGVGPWSEVYKFNVVITGIDDEKQIPTKFALLQNYPNPFNPSTTITYHLPKTSNVELKIYDVIGNEIATLVNEEKPTGVYEIQLNVAQDSRPALSSGIYFYKLTAGDFVSTKKMILIK
jgi:hypothetical protein